MRNAPAAPIIPLIADLYTQRSNGVYRLEGKSILMSFATVT